MSLYPVDEASFVDLVEEFAHIWDKKHQLHKDQIAIGNSWQSISEIIGISVKECKDLWEYVRAKYIRERRTVKTIPCGSGAYDGSWIVFNRLGFLNKVIQTRRIKITKLTGQSTKGISDKWIEKEFVWQEKHFSKFQKEFYADKRNCLTEREQDYHNKISALEESEEYFLFSYVKDEEYIPETEMSHNINYLQKAMDSLELPDASKENEYNLHTSLSKSMENPFFKSDVENMYLMVDLGEYFEDTWIKDEKLLCIIKYNKDLKILSVYPDFTNTQPYILKVQNEEEKVYGFYIENSSKNIPESIKVNEEALIQKVNNYKRTVKNQSLSHTFFLPPKNKLFVFLFLEISSAKYFEYADLYVQYYIDLPEMWYCQDQDDLRGRTQICRSVNEQGLVHFGHCFEVLLEYHIQNLQQIEHLKSPYIYFEVMSKDSWDRHRTEGLCYRNLPISLSGTFSYKLNCYCFAASPSNDLRRFFIGDCQNYDDVTWIGLPSNSYDANVLNKFGTKTVGTGELNVKINIIHQSQAFLEEIDENKEKNRLERMIFDKLSSSSLIKSVEQVIREFKMARRRMLQARKNI